jgi:hypothetical protein
LELLRAQVTEHAQTKVESASRFPLRISGTVLSSTFVNSGNPNWLDIPNIGRPPTTAPDDGTFSSTLRQSRIAFDASGPALGDWTTSATLAFDFFGGIPGFQTGQVMGLPRLLYAFARFDSPRATILAGQDDAIIAPRNPTSLAAFSFPALFRSGNLYLRVPQVRAEGRVSAGPALLRAIGGITAPIGGDIAGEAYLFVPPDLPGERSQRPAVQARVVVEVAPTERKAFAVGVSGHQGTAQRAGAHETWIVAGDIDARWEWFGVAGELYLAERAGAYGAALGQQTRSRGGWGELRIEPNNRWRFVGGLGADDVDDAIASGLALRRNSTGFGGVTFRWTPEIALGVEYFGLRTTPAQGSVRRNHHVNWVLRYDF